MAPKTLYEKIWDAHVVHEEPGQPSLIYIDRHLVHEGTSPQAFAGLKAAGRKVRRPELTFAVMDHSVSTKNRALPILDADAAGQFEALTKNCRETGVRLFDLHSKNQGIVHIIGPELGITQPGFTIVCGDSHTSTHGAMGALAFGIGTSEIEHVLATQCLWMYKPKTFAINITGKCKNPHAITAKDIILSVIRMIGTAGGTGTIIEYKGEMITDLSIEQRMTICNMSIEAGARAGLIVPDQKAFDYIRGRTYAPKGEQFEKMVDFWRESLVTDANAKFDRDITLNVNDLVPQVSWGTNPSMVIDVTDIIPHPDDFARGNEND